MSLPTQRFLPYAKLKLLRDRDADLILNAKIRLSPEERHELEQRSINGLSQDDKEILIRSHLELILRCTAAWHRLCPRAETVDLLLEGITMVYEAIDRYDARRARFTTFVVMLLSTQKMRFVARNWHAAGIRVPETVFTQVAKMHKYDPNWEQSTESCVQAAKQADVSSSSAVSIQSLYRNNLDASASNTFEQREDRETTRNYVHAVVVDRRSNRDPESLEKIKTMFLKRLDSVPLTASERETLHGRLGSDTLKDIGDRLGVSRERARQLEASAIAKIKESRLFADIEDLWTLYVGDEQLTERPVTGEAHLPLDRRPSIHMCIGDVFAVA